VTIDHLIGFVVVALLIGSSLFSGARKAKRGFDKLVDQQRSAEPDRIARIEAEMARRGISPPPVLQAALDAFQSAAQPTGSAPATSREATPFVPQPAYSPPPRQPQQRRAPPTPSVLRTVTPVARSVDVPPLPGAPAGSTRRTLAEAFGDPAHARNAVILAEILAPPVALR
jgi:hypothetical protein